MRDISKKIQYLLAFSILFTVQNSFSQIKDSLIYKATYRLTFDDTKTKNLTKSEDMVLFIGNSYTKFSSKGKHKRDSILLLKDRLNLSFSEVMRNTPKTQFEYLIIHNLSSSDILYHQKIVKDKFLYQEKIDFNWLITEETKQLLNYNCQKAKTNFAGREYIAWYTTELPISSGPYKFFGLPGLIIEIYDSKKEYHFSLVEFKNLSKKIPLKFENDNFINVDKVVFYETLDKFNENPFKMLEQSGISIDFSGDEQKNAMLKEHKKELKNKNPIELKKQ